jgi:hypothetical protein
VELKQFFQEVKNYWGPYENQGTAKRTWEYVAKKIPKRALPQLLSRLMQDVSTQFKHVPDIHDISVAYRALVSECALLPPGGSDRKKIEYNMENHREEILECFANLRDKLGF